MDLKVFCNGETAENNFLLINFRKWLKTNSNNENDFCFARFYNGSREELLISFNADVNLNSILVYFENTFQEIEFQSLLEESKLISTDVYSVPDNGIGETGVTLLDVAPFTYNELKELDTLLLDLLEDYQLKKEYSIKDYAFEICLIAFDKLELEVLSSMDVLLDSWVPTDMPDLKENIKNLPKETAYSYIKEQLSEEKGVNLVSQFKNYSDQALTIDSKIALVMQILNKLGFNPMECWYLISVGCYFGANND